MWYCVLAAFASPFSIQQMAAFELKYRNSIQWTKGLFFSTRIVYSKETFVSVIHSVLKYIETKMAK